MGKAGRDSGSSTSLGRCEHLERRVGCYPPESEIPEVKAQQIRVQLASEVPYAVAAVRGTVSGGHGHFLVWFLSV